MDKAIIKIITILGIILSVGLIIFFTRSYQKTKLPTKTNPSVLDSITSTKDSTPSPNTSNQVKTIALTPEEVAKHNSPSDCWLIVKGNVYDVTSFINSHPGGTATIIAYCGQDATGAFLTKGGKGSHSNFAVSLLKDLYIGKLNEKAIFTKPTIPPQKLQGTKGKKEAKYEEEEFEEVEYGEYE